MYKNRPRYISGSRVQRDGEITSLRRIVNWQKQNLSKNLRVRQLCRQKHLIHVQTRISGGRSTGKIAQRIYAEGRASKETASRATTKTTTGAAAQNETAAGIRRAFLPFGGEIDEQGRPHHGGDSGIGRAVALLFAKEGADCAVVYLNEHRDAKETQRLVEEEGRKCLLIAGDVGDEKFCKRAVAKP
jgi:enoyl-ACP reductase-like protein